MISLLREIANATSLLFFYFLGPIGFTMLVLQVWSIKLGYKILRGMK
jgi:hypothetical protein